MTTLSPKIYLQEVYKAFGPKKVLQGLNLKVEAGQSMVVIGGSGTGKSVMLKCLLGLIQPDSGSIQIDGQELVGVSETTLDNARRNVGMLFQGSALFDSLPVWENIFFGLLQKKMVTRKDARALASERLAAVGLQKEVVDLYPAELSGGMQRRVGIARAVAAKPDIIFFDEPTAGLDPIISGVINDLILKNVRELGATAVTITHDMASARKIADRIAMIHQGKIVWQGEVKDLDHSDNPYIEQFMHGRTQGPINVDVT